LSISRSSGTIGRAFPAPVAFPVAYLAAHLVEHLAAHPVAHRAWPVLLARDRGLLHLAPALFRAPPLIGAPNAEGGEETHVLALEADPATDGILEEDQRREIGHAQAREAKSVRSAKPAFHPEAPEGAKAAPEKQIKVGKSSSFNRHFRGLVLDKVAQPRAMAKPVSGAWLRDTGFTGCGKNLCERISSQGQGFSRAAYAGKQARGFSPLP
jgi:hypothetical protein